MDISDYGYEQPFWNRYSKAHMNFSKKCDFSVIKAAVHHRMLTERLCNGLDDQIRISWSCFAVPFLNQLASQAHGIIHLGRHIHRQLG